MEFETEIGPGSDDEGVDLRLIKRSDIGSMLILVQAKRYKLRNPITLEPVQALYGAVNKENANKGVLVRTGRFHPAAEKFASSVPYQIELADNKKLREWIAKVRTK